MSYRPDSDRLLLRGQNLWEIPPAPNALDDEFEDDPLDAAWGSAGFGQALDFGNAPDPYAAPTSSFAATAQSRSGLGAGSWLKFQVEAGVGSSGIHKPLGALPANQLVWGRFFCSWRNATAPTILDGRIEMSLFETGQMGSAIPLNGTNIALLDNDRNGAEISAGMWSRVAGTGFVDQGWLANRNQATSNEARAGLSGYLAIQKLGLDYHGWISTGESGSWVYMGSVNNASGSDWDSIAIWGRNELDTNPGALIVGCDFIRVVNSAVFLP